MRNINAAYRCAVRVVTNRTFNRVCASLFVLSTCIMLAGCTANWVGEASNIIQLLVPAVESILGILTMAGLGLSPTLVPNIENWATQAKGDLATIGQLISQYNTATEQAKPGLLQEINTAVSAVIANLQTILPELHIDNPEKQQAVDLVVESFQSELEALLNLIPVVQGTVTAHADVKARIAALKTPQEFKADFNNKVLFFGPQFEIK